MTKTFSRFELARLQAGVLLCMILLFAGLGFAQKLVTARATIPFNFWAQGREFQAGDYILDNAFPGSASIHREGSNLSIAVPVVLYSDTVDKENAKMLFVFRDGKYVLVEIWSARDRLVVTSEFQHRGDAAEQRRQVPLTLVESHKR